MKIWLNEHKWQYTTSRCIFVSLDFVFVSETWNHLQVISRRIWLLQNMKNTKIQRNSRGTLSLSFSLSLYSSVGQVNSHKNTLSICPVVETNQTCYNQCAQDGWRSVGTDIKQISRKQAENGAFRLSQLQGKYEITVRSWRPPFIDQ